MLAVEHAVSPPALSITVVIVTYNSQSTISIALDRLRDAYESGLVTCIVVDNASQDATVDLVAKKYPWVRIFPSEKNLGFGRGCNLGFQEATTKYVLFLNPDAHIEKDSLIALSRFMDDHSDAGIVSPATQHRNGVFQHAGKLTTPRRLVAESLGLLRHDDIVRVAFGDPTIEVEWVCGGIMMIRRDLLERLGGFDPRFFLYFEETDLLLRARRHGARVFVVGAAHGYHEGGASALTAGKFLVDGCIAEHYYPSRYYYLVKNFGWFRATIAELIVALADLMRSLRSIVTARGQERLANPLRRPILRLPRAIDKGIP